MSSDTAPHPDGTKPAFLMGIRKVNWQERRRLLYFQAWIATLCAYLILAFAYFWPQDYREESPSLVVFGWTAFILRTFIYHLGLMFLVIPLVALWRRRWRLLLVALPALLIAVGPSWWQYRPRSAPSISGKTMKAMSVNLLMINHRTGPIIEEIKSAQPDVLFLQEYTDHWHEAMDAAIGEDFPHRVYITREDSFGTAVYSRKPFKGHVERHLKLGSGGEPQVRVVIDFNGRDVALYNIHLLPPWGLEYTIETRTEFADLLNVLSREKLPVIIAGDFNFTERSPQAAALREIGVLDAQDIGGWGRGSTWPVSGFFRWIPSIRLDHLYLTGGLTCTDCKTGIGQGSDHRPVIAKVGFGG